MTLSELIDQYTDQYVAAVAAGEIEGEAIGAPLAGDLGWGSDLAGWQDITPEATERSGDDPMVPIEAMLRRLDTERGELPDDDTPEVAEYGYPLRSLLNKGTTPRQIESLGGVLEGEIEKDDRFSSVQVGARWVRGSTDALEVAISGDLVLPNSKTPFSATLVVTSAEVLIKAISV
jgi:hypothetical protein